MRPRLAWSLAVLSFVSTHGASAAEAAAPAATPEARERQGFFMRFAPKFGTLFLSSNANVLSGFRQEILGVQDGRTCGVVAAGAGRQGFCRVE